MRVLSQTSSYRQLTNVVNLVPESELSWGILFKKKNVVIKSSPEFVVKYVAKLLKSDNK